MQNRQWLINGNPRGRAMRSDDFLRNEVELSPLGEGEVRIKVEYLSFDPSLKGQMENIGYADATALGEVMRASGVGEVVESKAAFVPVGAKVMGLLGWQDYATLPGDQVEIIENHDLLTAYLGPLGGTGLTAYFGLLHNGKPKEGDMLVVTGAAGAVGSMVGQIGKIKGCDVVGVAGGPEKCAWIVNEVGFDAAIDYKNDDVKKAIKEHCPNGIDIFFDNVGGPVLDIALARIALYARVIICGAISRYEMEKPPPGPANYFNLVFKRAHMMGILVSDHAKEFPQARAEIAEWMRQGKITYKEDIQEGFDNIPATLNRLFSGQNFGKQLLRMD